MGSVALSALFLLELLVTKCAKFLLKKFYFLARHLSRLSVFSLSFSF
jgi:hypothetical protein